LELPGEEGVIAYRRAATYPSPTVSRGLRKRIWLLAPYNLPLAAVFGTVQVLLAFMMGLHLRDRHDSLDLVDLRRALWESPTAFLLILLMMVSLAAMVRLAHEASGVGRFLLGRCIRCCNSDPWPDAAADAPWFAPVGREIEPHLIEKPLRIDGRPSPGTSPAPPVYT